MKKLIKKIKDYFRMRKALKFLDTVLDIRMTRVLSQNEDTQVDFAAINATAVYRKAKGLPYKTGIAILDGKACNAAEAYLPPKEGVK